MDVVYLVESSTRALYKGDILYNANGTPPINHRAVNILFQPRDVYRRIDIIGRMSSERAVTGHFSVK